MNIGKKIVELREARGMQQVELAEKIGITKQLLYKYEAGVITNIPSDNIARLARALEVSPSVLMGWDAKEKAPSEEGARYADLVKMLDTLPDEALDKVVDYVTMLVQRYS